MTIISMIKFKIFELESELRGLKQVDNFQMAGATRERILVVSSMLRDFRKQLELQQEDAKNADQYQI